MAEEKIIEGGSGVGGRSMGPRYHSLCGRNAQSDPPDDEPDGLEHYGPPPPGSKPEPIVLLSSDNEVEDVTPWDLRVQQTSKTFLEAEEIFISRATGVPNVSGMIQTLCKFMNECGVNAFRKGERRDNFDDVVRQLKSMWKPTDSALLKAWPKYYCAKKLALLVHLHLEEQADSAARKAKDPNKYKGVVRNNGLRRLFRKLIQLYEPLLKKKVETLRRV